MAKDSAISWTDNTQNFWVGCTKVSAACDFCYAEQWSKQAGRKHLWNGKRERTKDWSGPSKWNRQAERQGYPIKVFTNSLADFFDNQAEEDWRHEAWAIIRSTPYLQWQILTKRPQNIHKMLPSDWGSGYHNVWLGMTAENQDEYWRRREYLFNIPAAVHFVSYEPALGPLSIQGPIVPDWIIVGGESGPNRRHFDLKWAEELRRECEGFGVQFYFKQDSHLRAGQQGRASDDLWSTKQFPNLHPSKSA